MTTETTRLAGLPAGCLRALLVPGAKSSAAERKKILSFLQERVDWTSLAKDINRHAVGTLLFNRLREWNWAEKILPAEVAAAWEADAQHARLQYLIQRRDALEINRLLTRHGIRHAFFKGMAYRETLYSPPWTRMGGDSDLLVDPCNVELCRAILFGCGFQHAACDIHYQNLRPATDMEIRAVEAKHYELAQFIRVHPLENTPDWFLGPSFVQRAPFAFERLSDAVVFNSVIDCHWSLHLALKDEMPLNSSITVTTSSGQTIPILSPEWSLFTTCFKLYFEAFDRPGYGLHHLLDIIALLDAHGNNLDWNFLAGLFERHLYQAAGFYTLNAAQNLAGKQLLPEGFLTPWLELPSRLPDQPETLDHTTLDFGDFIPSMLGERSSAYFPLDS